MPATTKTPLGASTTNRKWYLDVNTGTEALPVWTGVFGITEFTAPLDNTLQDDSDYDSDGYKSQTKTASQWSITGTVARKVTAASATAYDPGQEAIRLAADENGVANSVHVRWYEMEEGGPRVEAYEGRAAASWTPNGGAMDALSTAGFVLTGQGKRTAIAHPDTP
jgi:hypothetical protein